MIIKRRITEVILIALFISSCSNNNFEEIPTATITTTANPTVDINTPIIQMASKTATKEECQKEIFMEDVNGLMLYVKGVEEDNSDIFVMDMRTGEEFRITEDPAIDWMPSISSDGKKIAFTSNRRGDLLFGLYAIEIKELHSGVTEEMLNPPKELVAPNNQYQIYWPAWSPIDNWIAYSTRKGLNSFVDIINYDTLGWWRINSANPWEHYASWAPNRNQLYLINSDDGGLSFGSIIQQIDVDEIINKKLPKQIYYGENIVIQDRISINTKSEILLSQYMDEILKVIKILPGEVSNKIFVFGDKKENEYQPLWSMDNKWIAYIGRVNDNRSIHVYNIASGKDYGIFTTNTMTNISVVWSKDSKYLAYIRKAGKAQYYLEIVSVESLDKNGQSCEIAKKSFGPINTWEFTLSAWINN